MKASLSVTGNSKVDDLITIVSAKSMVGCKVLKKRTLISDLSRETK